MFFNKKNIFLIDGIGALFSFISIWVLLIGFPKFFGVPIYIAKNLSILPLLFSLFSLTCYTIKPSKWFFFLRLVSMANVAYCLLTLIIVVIYYNEMTVYGVLYFIIEKLIVLPLAWIEWHLAKIKNNE
jgi:hypothetical protein